MTLDRARMLNPQDRKIIHRLRIFEYKVYSSPVTSSFAFASNVKNRSQWKQAMVFILHTSEFSRT